MTFFSPNLRKQSLATNISQEIVQQVCAMLECLYHFCSMYFRRDKSPGNIPSSNAMKFCDFSNNPKMEKNVSLYLMYFLRIFQHLQEKLNLSVESVSNVFNS